MIDVLTENDQQNEESAAYMQMLLGYARLAINFCYPAIIPLLF